MASKKRYAVVGTGGRARGYITALASDYRDVAELVGFCDASPTRIAAYNELLSNEYGTPEIAGYSPDKFEQMIKEKKVDTVVVVTTDATHHTYIVKAMDLGCDVICEKPVTTDAEKANQILEAIDRTGQKLTVTFNMRYNPKIDVVKRLLRDGTIGEIKFADLQWTLDTRHGADYFRRWHATKANSGGLLVHKSTHHFDVINWWLDDRPQTVYAMGDLYFYGRKNAEARGEHYDYDRYSTDKPEARKDPFAFAVDNHDEWMRKLYLNAEKDSGYIRDKNVFGDHVDIEDAVSISVRYRRGPILNYSLVAFSPWEGFHASITGTKGRIELIQRGTPHVVDTDGKGESIEDAAKQAKTTCTVYPMFKPSYEVEIPKLEGGHGGSDPLLRADVFSPTPPADELGRRASHIDGVASALIGISANESMRTGQPIQCDDLVKLPDETAAAVS